jgi:hypothetical protein
LSDPNPDFFGHPMFPKDFSNILARHLVKKVSYFKKGPTLQPSLAGVLSVKETFPYAN